MLNKIKSWPILSFLSKFSEALRKVNKQYFKENIFGFGVFKQFGTTWRVPSSFFPQKSLHPTV